MVAFTAHHVIAADVDPDRVLGQLPPGDLGAPMKARFLTWLGDHLGAEPGMLDVVLVAAGAEKAHQRLNLLSQQVPLDHPRVARAARYRQDLAAFTDPERRGVMVLGRGLAHRWEVSVEVEPAYHGMGLGRRMAEAARSLVPAGEPLFAQIAPGNVRSLRAFLAAGFRPIAAEVLFLRLSDPPTYGIVSAGEP